jgi:hypothetical protein
MKLFARVKDPELLLKMLNEMGMAFYRVVEGNTVEAVYFSANRQVVFLGEMSAKQLDSLKGQAYPVEHIRVDDQRGIIEVGQMP